MHEHDALNWICFTCRTEVSVLVATNVSCWLVVLQYSISTKQ
jgi:hypothetical protein